MNLCGYFLIQLVSLTSLSINLASGDPDLSKFHRISGSRLSLEINNKNATTVNILKWNSILEPFPVADLPFFLSTEPQGAPVEQSLRAHANYLKVLGTDFFRIPPLERRFYDIDISRYFHITRRGLYRVRWNDILRGYLGDETLASEPLQRHQTYELPRIEVKYEMTVQLDQSSMTPQFQNTVQCGGHFKTPVEDAKKGAEALARSPYDQREEKRRPWREFFNGNDIIEEAVTKVYNNIRDFPFPRAGNSNTDILEHKCATNDMAPCGPNVVSYQYLIQRKSEVVFCPLFFDVSVVKPLRECEFPGPLNKDMFDRTGIYLRAYLRSDLSRVGNPIKDGLLNMCYGYDCAVAVASNRDTSRLENSRFRGIAPSDGKPEDNAANYELYAYTMRAKGCAENKPEFCSGDWCLEQKDRVCTLVRNNRDIVIGIANLAMSVITLCVSITVSVLTS
ncbi:MAG: hypothetical protein M1812_004842 [Candelaria pacifica]|nr:MAG: hypothetical protein M1812_004842 [Candelaria pacifica]